MHNETNHEKKNVKPLEKKTLENGNVEEIQILINLA